MVKKKNTIIYECKICGLEYETYAGAESCENLHEKGRLIEVYLHISYNLGEICDEYDLTVDEGNLVLNNLDDVKVLVRIKNGELEIIGLDGEYIDKNKSYDMETY